MSTGTEALEFGLMQKMTPEQRMTFHMQYLSVRKDPNTTLILALFCLSRFYLGQVGLGVLQWIANFFVVGLVWAILDIATATNRTHEYNARKAQEVAALIIGNGTSTMPKPNHNAVFCNKCGGRNSPDARFCGACGGTLTGELTAASVAPENS